jgi:hypothetical protein
MDKDKSGMAIVDVAAIFLGPMLSLQEEEEDSMDDILLGVVGGDSWGELGAVEGTSFSFSSPFRPFADFSNSSWEAWWRTFTFVKTIMMLVGSSLKIVSLTHDKIPEDVVGVLFFVVCEWRRDHLVRVSHSNLIQ